MVKNERTQWSELQVVKNMGAERGNGSLGTARVEAEGPVNLSMKKRCALAWCEKKVKKGPVNPQRGGHSKGKEQPQNTPCLLSEGTEDRA